MSKKEHQGAVSNIKEHERSLCDDQKFRSLECPFTWRPTNDVNCRDVVTETEDKLADTESDGEECTPWTKFVMNLILCYEYAIREELPDAFQKQEECETILNNIAITDDSLPTMGRGLKHISNACKFFLFLKSNCHKKANDMLADIAVDDMDCKDRASILCVHGAVLLEYGSHGMKKSVPLFEEAVKLDSSCGEWYFLLGKSLSRVRRIEAFGEIPDKRELEALETAVRLSNNTFYMVLLAQSYLDTAHLVSINTKSSAELKSQCNSMNQKANDMYMKAIENSKGNPYILQRCANGFMKIPSPWRNITLAEECVMKCIGKSVRNVFLYQIAGSLFQMKGDLEKAKYYFAYAAEHGNFGACMELLRIKMRENSSYNAVPDLERYLFKFKEESRQQILLAHLGTYIFAVQNDFNTALKYWMQIIEKDINSKQLAKFIHSFHQIRNPFNISQAIVENIVQKLDEGRYTDEEKLTYEKVMQVYREHHPGLVISVERYKRSARHGRTRWN